MLVCWRSMTFRLTNILLRVEGKGRVGHRQLLMIGSTNILCRLQVIRCIQEINAYP